MKKKNTKDTTKCSQYNVIIIVIDEFQQLNLFVFELLFYMIGEMSVKLKLKPIIKFVVSLTSLLKKSTNYLKMLYFYKILGPLGVGWAFFFFGFGALGLGLGPALSLAS